MDNRDKLIQNEIQNHRDNIDRVDIRKAIIDEENDKFDPPVGGGFFESLGRELKMLAGDEESKNEMLRDETYTKAWDAAHKSK